LKFPPNIIVSYPNKIINIHPALLPKYGGNVWNECSQSRCCEGKETGITIHYVNEHYDEGGVVFQKKVILSGNETRRHR
jgi:phosphoribosylglycinamide formyltransferase-1